MSEKKTRDWVRTGSIAAMGEWLRKESGALCVVVIRRDDCILAADQKLAPGDALRLIHEYAPGLALDLEASRKEKRSAARMEFGELKE